jgi:DNA-binding CsgD family transcriptional regulator
MPKVAGAARRLKGAAVRPTSSCVRHVHLIPARDARLLREWAPHEIPAHKPRDGRVERSARAPAPAGRPACRCCGFPIEHGEPAISADYRWQGGGAQPIWLHAHACAWGSAHEAATTAGARPRLTRTEQLVLELAELGASVPATARQIGRAARTVEDLITKLNKQLGTRTRAEAAAVARADGLLTRRAR